MTTNVVMTSDPSTDSAPDGTDAATMAAVVQSRYGDPTEVLEVTRTALPTVEPDDVLVRVAATSVNTPDWAAVVGEPLVLRPAFGVRRPAVPIRGTDVAGVVEQVGDAVTDLQPGDEVFGSTSRKRRSRMKGTFAELTVAPADQLVRKPATVSFVDAAAGVMSGVTALVAMRDAAPVRPGMRVLVNGASGGVGTFAVQIAKARGAHVTAVCSGANAELVRSIGADEVVDYTVERFVDGDVRYDVVLDNVMNHPPSAVARVLTDDGVFVPNSLGTGRIVAGLPRMARSAILGLGRTNVSFATCTYERDNLSEIAELLESGVIRSVIDEVHDLAGTTNAVLRMLSHRARGNVVIEPGRSLTR